MIELDAVGGPWLPPVKGLGKWLMALLLSAGAVTSVAESNESEPKFGTAPLAAIERSGGPLFALPSLDGATHDLTQHRGRVVLVHFFATWCEPCRPEMASLRELQSRLDGQPFAIVAISVAEADGAVRRFFAGDAAPFSVLLDRDRSVTKAWSIHTLPSTVVLDHGLKPRLIAEGDVDWGRSDVMNMLADLLREMPGQAGGSDR
jgi:thiol-disulfide isomerase/thioredoxin